jgi:SP family sugar:H+ symporter-like MFS transporter
MGLMFFQQLTGVNVIVYYAPIIFETLGINSLTTTAIIGVIMFLSTFLAIFKMDHWGRKPMLFYGGIGMFLSMTVSAILVGATASTTSTSTTSTSSAGYLISACICMYTFWFAATWGPGGWVVISELFPLRTRGKGVGLSASTNWIVNTLISFVTPLMLNSDHGLGTSGTFFFFAGCIFLSILFTLFCIPETTVSE